MGTWKWIIFLKCQETIFFRVDLYNISQDGRVLTYTFNVGAQNTFGFIFISAITMGGIMTAVIFIYVYFSKRKAKST